MVKPSELIHALVNIDMNQSYLAPAVARAYPENSYRSIISVNQVGRWSDRETKMSWWLPLARCCISGVLFFFFFLEEAGSK